VLQRVEVLRLVDEEVSEAPTHQRPKGIVGFDRSQIEVEEVVEVDDTGASSTAHARPPVRRIGQAEQHHVAEPARLRS
jgi:hypothetical protein